MLLLRRRRFKRTENRYNNELPVSTSVLHRSYNHQRDVYGQNDAHVRNKTKQTLEIHRRKLPLTVRRLTTVRSTSASWRSFLITGTCRVK